MLYHALVVRLSPVGPTEASAHPSSWRAALAPAIEPTRDGSDAASLPVHIRAVGRAIGQADREYIARKLAKKTGKFAPAIERITVRLSDVNGPKGGPDQNCQITIVLSGLPTVVVNEIDVALRRVADRAIDAAARAVQTRVQRRRLKPLRHRPAGLRRGRPADAGHAGWR